MANIEPLTQNEMGQLFDNPIMKDQVTGDQFFRDRNGEIRLKRDFLGERDYISLDEVVQEVKRTGKRVILNIGDSSTSGWNSDVLSLNDKIKQEKGKNLNPKQDAIYPIFTYKTYSDCLRDLVGDRFVVVNAGIPTHTSLNGLRRLKELVHSFDEAGITINYVTAYYGNNDSVCNANLEEKNRRGLVGRVRNFLTSKEDIVTRTSPTDYKDYMSDIVKYCRKKGISPILIEPAVPLYWEPGRRVKRESDASDNNDESNRAVANTRGGKQVLERYCKALNLWERANEAYERGNLDRAIELYEEAKENDYITPRIKEQHLQELRDLAKEAGVSLLQIDIPRDKDDGKDREAYFGDYCHPIERANELYAQEVARTIRTLDMFRQDKDSGNLPTDTYTLY